MKLSPRLLILTLPIKFEQYSNEVIATAFDMQKDAYNFSNVWPGEEGKCYGMAATSILYFNGKLSLPPDKTTYDLDKEKARPKIDDYQERLLYNDIIATWLEHLGNNKMEEDELFGFGYKDLKENIGKEEPMIFFLGGKGLKKSHAVVAYRIVEDENNKASYILIYDPNNPYKQYFCEAFPYITYNRNSRELISYEGYTKFKLAKAEPCYNQIIILSPASLCVYDSQGRVTGLVNGETKNEIPYSLYEEENETITIFFPFDSYRYEVVGTEEGTYGLGVTSVEEGEATNFTATDIPTSSNATHQYTIDWEALSQGEKGVTVQIDSDGDGVFEQNVTTDDTFQLPIASFTYTPENPVVNETITFNASNSCDPDGTITNYGWNFGDGDTMDTTEPLITHSYVLAGEYTVNLTVTDDDGATNATAKMITVSGMPDLVITHKWLCWPDNCTICYNVTNIGTETAPECHNTTLYVDGVEVAHDLVPVDLAPGESYTGCFSGYEWTYTPPSDNITVCADNSKTLVELDEDNNCLTNIWMCGDVNGDRAVNVIDVVMVYKRALDPGYPLDLPWAGDVNCDRNINVIDVVMVYKRALDPGYDLNCCCEVV
jgi:PKD repeat protein